VLSNARRLKLPSAASLARCLVLSLFCVSTFAAAQALRVVEVRVEGKAVQSAVAITQFVPPQRTPAALQVQAGQALADGSEIGVPARTVVVLQSGNGNRIELAPDTRFTARVSSGGEVHTVLGGNARFDVQRPLSFFNVEFNRFVALVRGTAFAVTAGAGGEGAADVTQGRIAVQREIPTLMQDTGRQVEMLEQELLDAQTRPRQDWPAIEALRRYSHSEEALTLYTNNLKQAEQDKDRDGQMAALNNMGLTWLARGRGDQAQVYFRRMLTMAQGLKDDPWRARALNNLGAAALEQGDLKGAVNQLEGALSVNRALEARAAQRRIAQVEGNLGLAWRRLGDAGKAREYTERSLQANQQLAEGRDSAAVARNLEALGNIESDPAKAVQFQRQALQMRERLYGDTPHPDLASSHINLGVLATRAGDDRAAADHYGRALALREKLFAQPSHPQLAEALVRHGSALCRSGDIAAGLPQTERALAMRQTLSKGPVDADVVDAYRQVAACWARADGLGQYDAKQRMAEVLRRLKDYQVSATPKPPGGY
jgi:tetratricopeptide (TPR) repeat protein